MNKSNLLSSEVIPKVIFGTSSLGNLYKASTRAEKCAIVKECVSLSPKPMFFDSAGKYGAGLALESLGACLEELKIAPADVVISNKLGWYRSPLAGAEPTFEPGVWKDIHHDCVQKISYQGIIECYEQGNELLGGYTPQWVSVHDPDEYLQKAANISEREERYQNVMDAYGALTDLKRSGKVKAIGVGAKDWKVIEKLSGDVELDWVMIANSLTIKEHPYDLLEFIDRLRSKGVVVINSAVFHSGFLVGSDYFNYSLVKRESPKHLDLFLWRDAFFRICNEFHIKPAHACIQFALKQPGVASIALNTSDGARVSENLDMARNDLPDAFWERMKLEGLINPQYPYL